MLDDDNSTTNTEPTTVSRTRRRAAGRPAGPPAPVSTDIFAAPAEAASAPGRASQKSSGASKAEPETSSGPAGEKTSDKVKGEGAEQPSKKAAKKPAKKAAAAKSDAPDAPDAASDDAVREKPARSTRSRGGSTKASGEAKASEGAQTAEGAQTSDTQTSDTQTSDTRTADDAGRTEPAAKKSGGSRRRSGAKSQSDPAEGSDGDAGDARGAGVAVAFQAPEPVAKQARSERSDDDSSSDAGSDASTGDDTRSSDDADSEGGAPKRRRRSRGGRRRNKSDDAKDGGNDADTADESDDDADGGAAGTRRRRRRARAGENASTSPDDPENTVVKVREGRNPEDEITGVSGSTRLEAKKQRRREGREAGRRRAPIVSEAEFLARRESVERQMVVRQHVVTGGGSGADAYTQIAVLEDSVLVEHYVARESQTSLIGNVYLGKVQNVLPSMEAAFVDIGAGRNAVIYAGEVDWSGVENGRARKIEEALSPGQQILVQVTKDPVGQKGARLTSQVSLPGRFLVYVPGGQSNGISRKLPDTERARLKSLLKEVLPEDAGVIVRTAAEGATEEQLTRDVTALTARWDDIVAKAGLADGSAKGKGPQLLYAEPDLVIKVVRDLFNEDFASLVVEGPDAWDNISGYVSHVAPDLAERLSQWQPDEHEGRDSFDVLRIDEQIHKALDRKVWLPSGGSLIIDRTEAMTVVDVNTGKFTGSGGNLEETVTKNNLEAAEEIVRQLRLRDIGGIIVVDFIDMVLESNRDLVLRRLVECLGRDRTRHQVAEVTSLGLVQMTRKRIGTGLLESFSTDCEHCKGRGVVITAEPVEPKKDEPRRGRRSRGGSGNGGSSNGSGSGNGNGAGNGRRGGQRQDDAKDESSKDESSKDESSKDESSKDESTKDESTKDESGTAESGQRGTSRRGRSGGRGAAEAAETSTETVADTPTEAVAESPEETPAETPAETDSATDTASSGDVASSSDAENTASEAIEQAVEEQASTPSDEPALDAPEAPEAEAAAQLPTALPDDATASPDADDPTVLTEPDSTP